MLLLLRDKGMMPSPQDQNNKVFYERIDALFPSTPSSVISGACRGSSRLLGGVEPSITSSAC